MELVHVMELLAVDVEPLLIVVNVDFMALTKERMSNAELRKALLSLLMPIMQDCGFSAVRSHNRFKRRRSDVTDRFSLISRNVTAHPMPYETAAASAPAARAWVMAARAVRPLRRPVATIEQISA